MLVRSLVLTVSLASLPVSVFAQARPSDFYKSTIPGVLIQDGPMRREQFITDTGADIYPKYVATVRQCSSAVGLDGTPTSARGFFQDGGRFAKYLKCVNEAGFPVVVTTNEYMMLTAPAGAMPGRTPRLERPRQ